jgi:hypothetical protein
MRYVEPFAGRANVFFAFAVANLYEYKKYWINDYQPNGRDTYKFLCALRSGDSSHPKIITKTLRARLREAKKQGLDTINVGKRNISVHLVEQISSFSGGFLESSGPSVRDGEYPRRPQLWGSLLNSVGAMAVMRAVKVRITNLDYRKVLAQCGAGDLVYL